MQSDKHDKHTREGRLTCITKKLPYVIIKICESTTMIDLHISLVEAWRLLRNCILAPSVVLGKFEWSLDWLIVAFSNLFMFMFLVFPFHAFKAVDCLVLLGSFPSKIVPSWCETNWSPLWLDVVGAKQPVHWFLGSKGLGYQQGTSVWVGSPKSAKVEIA